MTVVVVVVVVFRYNQLKEVVSSLQILATIVVLYSLINLSKSDYSLPGGDNDPSTAPVGCFHFIARIRLTGRTPTSRPVGRAIWRHVSD